MSILSWFSGVMKHVRDGGYVPPPSDLEGEYVSNESDKNNPSSDEESESCYDAPMTSAPFAPQGLRWVLDQKLPHWDASQAIRKQHRQANRFIHALFCAHPHGAQLNPNTFSNCSARASVAYMP